MHDRRPQTGQTRFVRKEGIWLPLLLALGLHFIFLGLPMTWQWPRTDESNAQIELELITYIPQAPTPTESPPEPETPAPLALPEPVTPEPEPSKTVVGTQPELTPAVTPPAELRTPPAPVLKRDLESMSEQDRQMLTNVILSRQFITEKSAADQLFGTPIHQHSTEPRKEFHYPSRQNMISMLDQPMPDIPFAHEPGLIYFAYDPGVKGDLQRFWDVITPEFGWRTKNGTEVKCILMVVIIGCGWK